MDKTLSGVLEFHTVFGQYIGEKFTVKIPQEVRTLRHNLMSEEYLELLNAEADNDLVEVADALCDLKYVLNGTIISHGLHTHWNGLFDTYEFILDEYKPHTFRIDDYIYSNDESFVTVLLKLDYFIKCKIEAHGFTEVFPAMFAEVQRSNMSKTCATLDEAMKTIAVREKEFSVPCRFFEKNGRYVVIRSGDRKALKSINYSKAQLAQFIPEKV